MVQRWSAGPTSTSLPLRIAAMHVATCATTGKLCDGNSTLSPRAHRAAASFLHL